MIPWLALGGIFVVSFCCTHLLVPYMVSIARRYRIVDHPDGKLKTHDQATPYLGGVAVYLGFMSGMALFFPVANHVAFAIIGATLLLFVGLIDDLLVLTPAQKMAGQILATCCFVRGGFYIKETFLTAYAPVVSQYAVAGISALWILTIINGFNLIDVMDGLATTVALCVTVSLCCMACIFHAYTSLHMLLALGGALLAFLMWNKPAARIYLGDAGSLCIGGVLAIAPFIIPWGQYYYLGFLTPVIVFFIPLIEITSLIIIRTAKGIPWYCGSPDHFCMYLKNKGWDVRKILRFVILFSVPLLFVSVAFARGALPLGVALFLGCVLNMLWGYCVFSRQALVLHVRSWLKLTSS